MKKISHKFSHDGLHSVYLLVDLAFNNLRVNTSAKPYDALLFVAIVRLRMRLSKILLFKFAKKSISFGWDEFFAVMIAFERFPNLGVYETVVIQEFLTEGGKKI